MRIGIIGGGVTGSATAAAFRGHCDEVRVWDVDSERRTHGHHEVVRCDVIFVCLPELVVDRYFADIGISDAKERNYVLRSTVPVGTTRRLAERYGLPNLVHSPEFLTERTAVADAANPRIHVVGIPVLKDQLAKGVITNNPIKELYYKRWPHVPFYMMWSEESELTKLALNGFFSTKVSYWNEVESYCRAAGVDYETVRASCVAEGRVGDLHTHVPGPDGKRGFGGRCLPKDLSQLIRCFHDAEVTAPILNMVRGRNQGIDRKKQP